MIFKKIEERDQQNDKKFLKKKKNTKRCNLKNRLWFVENYKN